MKRPSIALVTGCFDLLHYGHLKFLDFAASKADTLILGLESDQFIKDHKGPSRPIFSQKFRKYCLSQIKSVDQIIPIPKNISYFRLLKKIHPDFLIISSNDSKYKEKHQICQKLDIKLIVFPRLKNFSSSNFIASSIVESR